MSEQKTMITFSGTRHVLGSSKTTTVGWHNKPFELMTARCSPAVTVEDFMQRDKALKDCRRCFPPSDHRPETRTA